MNELPPNSSENMQEHIDGASEMSEKTAPQDDFLDLDPVSVAPSDPPDRDIAEATYADGIEADDSWDLDEDDIYNDDRNPLDSPVVVDAMMRSYFIDPEQAASYNKAARLPLVTPEAFDDWLKQQPPETVEELKREKEHIATARANMAAVHEKLSRHVPDLYEGRIPGDLERRLSGAQYAVGYNQSGPSTGEEAEAYLGQFSGVDLKNSPYSQRFMILDESSFKAGYDVASVVDAGYYGDSTQGRFVVVFPVADGSRRAGLPSELSRSIDFLPNDFEVKNGALFLGNPDESVNSKYVAGFIDRDGNFLANANFMREGEPALTVYVSEV